MIAKTHLKTALETIAQRDIPENTNLWPRIAAHIERKDTHRMNTKLKLTWIVTLILLGLLLVTTVAYALYHYFNDPGLNSAGEAGLITELDVTAQPTPLPTATPLEPAIQIGAEQMLEGITVTLDWVYLNDERQALGFSARGLPVELKLGMPQMSFGALTPQQVRGAGLALQGPSEVITGIYVVYQIVREATYDGQTEGHANVSLDIPILDKEGQTLKTFHFDVLEAPIHLEPVSGSNTYATRSNSVEMRLEWIKLTPQETQARLCMDSPDRQNWDIHTAAIQLAETAAAVAEVPTVQSQQITPIRAENGLRCVEVTFPVGWQGFGALHLVVNQLTNSNGQTLDGTWEFVWGQLPGGVQIPGTAGPTPAAPLATQVVGAMTATLIQAYADANRLAFAVHIDGLPEGYGLYDLVLKDANGNEINAGFSANSSDTEPGTFSLIVSPASSLQGARFLGQLIMGINPAPGENATAVFRFDLDLPVYPALIFKPQQVVVANGIEMRLDMIKITPSFTQVYLCYQKPTQNDWMIGGSSVLQIGDDQSQMEGYSLEFDADLGNIGKGLKPDWVIPVNTGRCVVVGYPVGHHNLPETLTLTIGELEQSLPEVIPDEQIQMARQKLRQEGIEMDWVVSFGNGGGGGGPVITKKPEGMTDEEVIRRLYELLGYYYPGPWSFEVPVNP
jgi:hypothetical protein